MLQVADIALSSTTYIYIHLMTYTSTTKDYASSLSPDPARLSWDCPTLRCTQGASSGPAAILVCRGHVTLRSCTEETSSDLADMVLIRRR